MFVSNTNKWWQVYSQKPDNSHRFARTGLAIAVGSLLACLALPGYGQSDDSSTRIQPTTMSPAPSNATVQQVTWALPTGEPPSLDYAKAGDYAPDTVVSALCDNLLRMTPDFTLAPGIATSWKQVDPLTLVYKIRKGVQFWDGSPLTAADVVYNLRRSKNPKTGLVYSTFYKNVKSIEQTGEYEVTVHFTQPDELFNHEMATAAGGIAEAAYMKHTGSKYGSPESGVMCTGPYRLKSWKPGDSITITANDDYWDSKLKPKVKQIKFVFINKTSTLVSALLAGSVDGAFSLPVSSIPALQSTNNGTLYFGRSFTAFNIYTLHPGGAVSDPKIRTALKLVVDRAAIADKIFHGTATPTRTWVPPSIWNQSYPPAAEKVFKQAYQALPSLKKPNFEKARKLVKEADGVSQPIRIAILAGKTESKQTATLIQNAAKKIGIPIHIDELPPTEFSNLDYLESARNKAGDDLILESDFFDIADPLDLLPYRVVTGGFFNHGEYSNPKVDQAIAKARASLDRVESAKHIVKAQKIYTKDSFAIPIVSPYMLTFMNNRITGAPTSFAVLFSPWAAYLGASK